MRLGQLARKAEKKPIELIEVLQAHGIKDYTHANSKVSEEHEKWVIDHFGIIEEATDGVPTDGAIEVLELSESSVEDEAFEKEEPADIGSEESEAELESVEEPIEEKSATPENDSQETHIPEEDEIELIKAPKIELPGLTVVGKIDLPEPKKKEPDSKKEDKSEESQRRNKHSGNAKNRQSKKRNNPDYNPVAAQRERQRKREEHEARKKNEQLKKKKKQHYQERVSSLKASPSQKNRSVKPASYTQVVAASRKSEVKTNKPNPIVRLWRWLNTY